MASLRISARQMEVLQANSEVALAPAIAAHLRISFPRDMERFDEQGLIAYAKEAIVLAHRYGLRTKQEFFRFSNLAARFGLSWDMTQELNWLHECMTDSKGGTPANHLDTAIRRALYKLSSEADSGYL